MIRDYGEIGKHASHVARRCTTFSALFLVLAMPPLVRGEDIFGTAAQIPPNAAAPLLTPADTGDCHSHALNSEVTLLEAIERALCDSPKTRSAWSALVAASANIGLGKSAFLPSLDANARYTYQHEITEVQAGSALESDYSKAAYEASVSLSWVLYDFGGRSAALSNSKNLFLAAQANQNSTLQAVFASTAKDYLGAQAAHSAVLSKRRIEQTAADALAAAAARVERGIAPITDQLQAKTALAQAVFERAKAEGELQIALGVLAIDMNLSPEDLIHLPEFEVGVLPDTSFVHAIHDLLEEAKRSHPRVLAAAAQWQAAVANVRFAQSQGLPIIRLIGESDRTNQPVSASLGEPALPALTRDNYIGLQITIPLLDTFSRGYQVQQAQAQADIQEQSMREVEQQVAIGVWSSVQTLRTDTENLQNTQVILESAQSAAVATRHRYDAGVGNILEVLNSQSVLAASEQQWIQAQLDWRVARLQLAVNLGNLGLWAVKEN